jgi:hypothetical protein
MNQSQDPPGGATPTSAEAFGTAAPGAAGPSGDGSSGGANEAKAYVPPTAFNPKPTQHQTDRPKVRIAEGLDPRAAEQVRITSPGAEATPGSPAVTGAMPATPFEQPPAAPSAPRGDGVLPFVSPARVAQAVEPPAVVVPAAVPVAPTPSNFEAQAYAAPQAAPAPAAPPVAAPPPTLGQSGGLVVPAAFPAAPPLSLGGAPGPGQLGGTPGPGQLGEPTPVAGRGLVVPAAFPPVGGVAAAPVVQAPAPAFQAAPPAAPAAAAPVAAAPEAPAVHQYAPVAAPTAEPGNGNGAGVIAADGSSPWSAGSRVDAALLPSASLEFLPSVQAVREDGPAPAPPPVERPAGPRTGLFVALGIAAAVLIGAIAYMATRPSGAAGDPASVKAGSENHEYGEDPSATASTTASATASAAPPPVVRPRTTAAPKAKPTTPKDIYED